jgi:hypothetical protein
MILHLLQIFLTDALTFIIVSFLPQGSGSIAAQPPLAGMRLLNGYLER